MPRVGRGLIWSVVSCTTWSLKKAWHCPQPHSPAATSFCGARGRVIWSPPSALSDPDRSRVETFMKSRVDRRRSQALKSHHKLSAEAIEANKPQGEGPRKAE